MRRRLPALLLLGSLVALIPLAYASPPDQTWLGGLYDDADFDDVVLAITSAAGAFEPAPLSLLSPLAALAGVVLPAERAGIAGAEFGASSIRAPPAP